MAVYIPGTWVWPPRARGRTNYIPPALALNPTPTVHSKRGGKEAGAPACNQLQGPQAKP